MPNFTEKGRLSLYTERKLQLYENRWSDGDFQAHVDIVHIKNNILNLLGIFIGGKIFFKQFQGLHKY